MIRPIDLQNTLLNAAQNAPAAQRAEGAERSAAHAAQAASVADGTHRDEVVGSAAQALGSRIDAKDAAHGDAGGKRKRRPRGAPFEQVVEQAGESADEPHRIDLSA